MSCCLGLKCQNRDNRYLSLGVKNLMPRGLLFGFLRFSFEREDRDGGTYMKSLASKLRHFLVSEDGPTAVEYAVMLALIVIVCLTAVKAIGTKANSAFNKVATTLPT